MIIALLALTASCGTSKFYSSTPATVEIVETIFNANDNYIRANEWMVENFNNAESVIQFSDKENGIVKGKYYITKITPVGAGFYVPEMATTINALITVKVKDSAAKITIDGSSNKYSTYMGNGYTPVQFDNQANALIMSFKNRMNEKMDNF